MKKKEKEAIRAKKIELAKFLANLAAGKEKNLKKGKNLRKEIAQMMTIVREKELIKG